jgi:hypothetical protein
MAGPSFRGDGAVTDREIVHGATLAGIHETCVYSITQV